MASWSVEFLLDAEKDLAKLDRDIRKRIIAKLDWLGVNFDSTFPVNLRGEFREFYKLRVGDWRVFYKVDSKNRTLLVCYIARRDEAYK